MIILEKPIHRKHIVLFSIFLLFMFSIGNIFEIYGLLGFCETEVNDDYRNSSFIMIY